MLALLSLIAAAGPPTLTCEAVEVSVPAESAEVERPKGFQWEGFRPIATLTDGRAVLLRGSALEGLSRGDLKRQTELDGPDRVSQLVIVDPNGKLAALATIPRGTPLEVHRTPDGGVVLARTDGSFASLDHIDGKGRWTGTTRLPADPDFHTWWRTHNPIRGTASASLIATGPGRALVTHGPQTTALNLVDNTIIEVADLQAPPMPTVHDKRLHEIVTTDRGQRLRWYTPELARSYVEDCYECRVTGLERTRRKGAAWSPTDDGRELIVVQPENGELVVTVRGVSTVQAQPPLRRIPIPAVAEGERFTWRLRTGPAGTALVAVSAPGSATPQLVWSIGPGAVPDSPPLSAPIGLVQDGEHLVADGVGGLVRMRAVRGEDAEERTIAVAILDPRSGRSHDVIREGDVDADLWAALSSPSLRDRAPDGTVLLRTADDPVMARMPAGASVARFERCRLTDP